MCYVVVALDVLCCGCTMMCAMLLHYYDVLCCGCTVGVQVLGLDCTRCACL